MKLLSAVVLGLGLGLAVCQADTETRLLLSAETAKAGETVWAGVEIKMDPHWHVYWRFAGDSGAPVKVDWTLPAGFTAGEINWPVPRKATVTEAGISITTYNYSDRVILLAPIQLAADVRPGLRQLTAALTLFQCEDKGQCVMTNPVVSATFTIGEADKPSADAGLLEEWRGRLPQATPAPLATAKWDTMAGADTRTILIDWESTEPAADFFPYKYHPEDWQGATETLPGRPGHVLLRKVIKKGDNGWPERVGGILVGKANSPTPLGVELDVPLMGVAAAATPATGALGAAGRSTSAVLMLVFAFLGGLILNVMPCVLPVIALKVLGFVSQSREAPARVKRLGLIYGMGVLVSFLVLAGLAIATQRAGGLASWGDPLRNPQFQVVITVLIALVALNLFGVFEVTIGSRVTGAAAGLAGKQGNAGAFFNGVLATLLATPCTAPFLTVALAFAFTQPPVVTVALFLAAGAGLALPFVVICWNPGLLKVLPKPGAWMEKFKIAMGFPMLATALWLMSVWASNVDDMLWLGFFLVGLVLAAWIFGEFVQRATRRKGLGLVICLLVLGLDYAGILEGRLQWREPAGTAQTGIDWKVWSPDAVEEARRAGHPVLVDFTAKSCLTCRINKATSLEIARTRAQLKAMNAVAFEADFTHEDPMIAKELRHFNSSGVPLVLVYPKDPGKPPEVLPTWLTPTIVLDALNKAAM